MIYDLSNRVLAGLFFEPQKFNKWSIKKTTNGCKRFEHRNKANHRTRRLLCHTATG